MSSRVPGAEPLLAFDWTDRDGPARAVVSAVASAADEDPVELDPLYDAVDPDALNKLLTARGPERGRIDGSVSFEYHGYDVVVSGRGRGYVYDRDVNIEVPAGRPAESVDE